MPPLSFRIATATTTTTTMTTTMCVSQASSTSLWLFLSPFCRRQRNGRRTPCPVFSSFFFLLLLLLLLLLLHDSRRKRRRRKEKKKRKKDGIWAAPRRAVGGSKAELPVDVGDDSPTPSSSSFLLRSTIFSPGFRRKEEEEVGEEIREEEYRFRRRRKEGPLGIFFFYRMVLAGGKGDGEEHGERRAARRSIDTAVTPSAASFPSLSLCSSRPGPRSQIGETYKSRKRSCLLSKTHPIYFLLRRPTGNSHEEETISLRKKETKKNDHAVVVVHA